MFSLGGLQQALNKASASVTNSVNAGVEHAGLGNLAPRPHIIVPRAGSVLEAIHVPAEGEGASAGQPTSAAAAEGGSAAAAEGSSAAAEGGSAAAAGDGK